MVLLILSHNVVDQDLWHEMALAREAVRIGHVPTEDPFAYTPTVHPFIQHEWGAGLIAWLVSRWFGGGGILALKFFLGAGIAAFAILRMRRDAPPVSLLALAVPAALILVLPGFGTLRAQVYSFFFFMVLMWMLDRDRDGDRRWIWFWLPMFVLWLNLHGGFIVAIVVVAAEWLERRLKRQPNRHLLLVLLSMVLLIPANPYGLGYYGYIIRALSMERPHIDEWKPVWVLWNANPLSLIVFVVSAGLLGYATMARRRRELAGLLIVLSLLAAAIRTNRMIYFYGFAWLTAMPGYLKGTALDQRFTRFWTRGAILHLVISASAAAIFMAICISRQPWELVVPAGKIGQSGDNVVYPVGAVDYLRRCRFQGNVMTFFPIGSYVTWKLYPQVRVSMDSRYETAYPPWLADENIELYRSARDWQRVLEAYPTDLVLVTLHHALFATLLTSAKWHLAYQDDQYAIFGKDGTHLPAEDHRGVQFKGVFP